MDDYGIFILESGEMEKTYRVEKVSAKAIYELGIGADRRIKAAREIWNDAESFDTKEDALNFAFGIQNELGFIEDGVNIISIEREF